MTKTKVQCLSGLCPNDAAWIVKAPVGGRYKEIAVCDDCLSDIRSTVYVQPIDEIR